ncbi:adenosylmethionine--8-amino-7-oxononanoate transaminase [bacterium]|nr:MAG: adenosylmethionine--8-amino-7-oxononanoate transaminase [bacterium]
MKNDLPIWYPFTPIKQAPLPIKIEKGKGAFLYDTNGKAYLDAISSWWVNTWGHTNPEITRAIKDQLDKLEHVIFAGFTHEPAEVLATSLLDISEHKFSKVFFSDNGSTAVEVALKMAVQWHYNQGKPKNKIIAFEGAYHGDTFGAMSAGARGGFNQPFESMFFDVLPIPYPATWEDDDSKLFKEKSSIDALKKVIATHKNEIACLIIEPLIQGAGGMKMCRTEFLKELEVVCKENQILVIYDEVMTGFGRTGERFAHIKASTNPDFVCLSKGLTGGFMPLSVTLTTDKIFQAYYDDDKMKTLYHGHSYTANPLSCAAAIESINQLRIHHKELIRIQALFSSYLPLLKTVKRIKNIRLCGTVLAFDIQTNNKDGYFNDAGKRLTEHLLNRGFIIRPLGNTVYFMPPYVTLSINLNEMMEEVLIFLHKS